MSPKVVIVLKSLKFHKYLCTDSLLTRKIRKRTLYSSDKRKKENTIHFERPENYKPTVNYSKWKYKIRKVSHKKYYNNQVEKQFYKKPTRKSAFKVFLGSWGGV